MITNNPTLFKIIDNHLIPKGFTLKKYNGNYDFIHLEYSPLGENHTNTTLYYDGSPYDFLNKIVPHFPDKPSDFEIRLRKLEEITGMKKPALPKLPPIKSQTPSLLINLFNLFKNEIRHFKRK